MVDKIELLDTAFLQNNKDKLREIDHWLKVLNWVNGWHYDLDIIWVLNNIERMGLKPGATIIDAGAGLGITQFILASRGYNVISLDFTERQIPKFAKGIFNIEKIDTDLGDYKHEYMDFMSHGQKKILTVARKNKFLSKLRKVINLRQLSHHLAFIFYRFKLRFSNKVNIYYYFERNTDHNNFGKITFLRGIFNNIPLESDTADVLISVSAFEHNTYKDMPGSVIEFTRVLKKGAPMFITTSASEKEDWYFEPAKSWNFTRETLSDWFSIPEAHTNFDFKSALERIKASKTLKNRIPLFYKFNGNNGLPFAKLEDVKYVPVGIIKIKNSAHYFRHE